MDRKKIGMMIDRQMDIQIDGQIDRQKDTQIGGYIYYRSIDRQIRGYIDIRVGRQLVRQIER